MVEQTTRLSFAIQHRRFQGQTGETVLQESRQAKGGGGAETEVITEAQQILAVKRVAEPNNSFHEPKHWNPTVASASIVTINCKGKTCGG